MTIELVLIGVDVPVVLYSGFLGMALDAACENDFEEVLLISHIGKLVKTAGGIMNTHQREADCRRELITAHAAAEGATTEMCRRLMEAATTDAAIEILDEEAGAGIADAAAGGEIADSSGDMIEVSGGYTSSLRERVCRRIMDAVMYYLNRRIESAYHIEAIMFSNQYGILEKSDGADELIEGWRG